MSAGGPGRRAPESRRRPSRQARGAGWILILARDHRRAKSRLAPALAPVARARLATAMLEDVLGAALSVGDGWRAAVVTDSRKIAAIARSRGASVVLLPARGARASARAALGVADAAGCDAALVVAADLPFARARDLRRTIAASARADVVVARDRHRTGTNAILLRPPLAIPPRFGRASLAAHLAESRSRGLRARILATPGLDTDIDTPSDLGLLRRMRRRAGPRTRAALAAIDGAGVTRAMAPNGRTRC